MAVQTMPHTTLLLVLITAQVFMTIIPECNGKTIPKFPAILVFGDSTVDSGNNNYILTTMRSDHSPYGLDFPGHVPTGRFSNGKLVPDLLASMIGLKEAVPPFLDPNLSNEDMLTGVNFASAGSGYDELTTSVTRVIAMSKQLEYLKNYTRRLEGIVGKKEAQRILSRALVMLSAGSNDVLFNYYDLPTRRIEFTIDEYHNFLINKLKDFVKELYHLGCRKVLVTGLPPIGCLPVQMTIESPLLRTCGAKENEGARSYNDKLEKALPRIETELPGSKFLYVDIYNPLMDMINNPKKYRIVETVKGCCGSGVVEVGPLCSKTTPVCADPSRYMFYDCIHPSESTYKVVSKKIAELLLPKL